MGGDLDVGSVLRQGVKSAVARWALAKRRARRNGRAQPAAHDEATHPADGRKRFAEDYTFAAAQADLGLLVRLEWLPGRDSHRLWLFVFRPDGVWALPGGQKIVRGSDRDRWRAGGIELDCVTPYKNWTLRYAGRVSRDDESASSRCSLDLTFVSEESPFSPGADDDPDLLANHFGAATWDAALLRSVRRVQSRGYVQLGELHGTLALGETLIPLRARCLRQHMWGVRDWGASDQAFQCFASWKDGRAAWVHSAAFPFVTLEGGFVSSDGELEPVRSIGVTLERRPDRAPAHASLTLEHSTGYCGVEAKMLSDATITVDGRGAVDVGFFQLPDDRGFGIWGGQRRVLPRRVIKR